MQLLSLQQDVVHQQQWGGSKQTDTLERPTHRHILHRHIPCKCSLQNVLNVRVAPAQIAAAIRQDQAQQQEHKRVDINEKEKGCKTTSSKHIVLAAAEVAASRSAVHRLFNRAGAGQ